MIRAAAKEATAPDSQSARRAAGHRRPRARKLASGGISSSRTRRRASSRRKSQNALGMQPELRRTRVGPLFHRWYSPGTGRYTRADAYPSAILSHAYGYAEGQPLTLVDPEGLFGFSPTPSGCEVFWGLYGRVVYLPRGTRYAHCMTTCRIFQNCGPVSPIRSTILKENYDLVLCVAFRSKKHCDSAFQKEDFFDNAKGATCILNCEQGSASLLNEPEPAPGPFSRLFDR